MEEVTVHTLKARKRRQISRTASLLHYSLLLPLENFWTLTLVDLEAGPLTQGAGKHRQQKVVGAWGHTRAGSCRVVCDDWERTAGPAILILMLPFTLGKFQRKFLATFLSLSGLKRGQGRTQRL